MRIMFGMGFGEIFLILLIAILVFGPGRLAEIGGGMGKAIREFKSEVCKLRGDIDE